MGSDTRQLQELIDDVRYIPEEVNRQLYDIVDRSSSQVEREWKLRWDGHETLPWLPKAITREIHIEGKTVTAEIGPSVHLPQGRLGSFIEFGTRTSAPIPGALPAIDLEEPDFVRRAERIKVLGVE